MQLPPAVALRLSDAADRRHFEALGPVTPSAAATVAVELADLAAQALLHGQHALADVLTACLEALPGTTTAAAALTG